MKPNDVAPRPKHTIPAVTKAVDLLRLLGEPGGETTTKALALRLGIPRTSCYRILRSLIARDWVRPTDGGGHELSLGLLPILAALRPAATLAAAVEPALRTLASRTQLTAKVSVRQGDRAVTVARVESPRETSVAVRLGASFPLAYGSSGAVLLSELSRAELNHVLAAAPAECWEHQKPSDVLKRLKELRDRGWCADFGAFRSTCHAISAPLRDASKHVAASVTIVGFPHELPRNCASVLAALLIEATCQAEEDLRKLGLSSKASLGSEP
jgi:DNA-binding IclR family transcriptional regulator